VSKRYVIVGDIHGCYVELDELFSRIGLMPSDTVIPVGDTVNGGPDSDSPRVIRLLMDIGAKPVCGNHEVRHLWADKNKKQMPPECLSASHRRTIAQFEAAGRNGIGIGYGDALEYFSKLPLFRELEDVTIVHAGLRYGIPLAEQQRTHEGMAVLLGEPPYQVRREKKATDGLPGWCVTYPRTAKPVVFGHESIRVEVGKVWEYPQRGNLYPVDTKCARGGLLTALVFYEGNFDNHLVYHVFSRQRN